jgi:DNA-binding transcriptional LysR family regulator
MLGAMLDLDAVLMVMALAREGSLARASRSLGLPRSTLTSRVDQLEESLGVKLIERGPRHLRLTEAGRLLVEQGAPVVNAARQLESSLRTGPRHRLRGALPPGLAWDLLEPLLNLQDASLQGLQLELVYTDREVHPIRDDFDLVLSLAPPKDGALYSVCLRRFSWCTVATPAYLAKRGTPRTAQELEHHACVAWRTPGGPSPIAWPLRAGGDLPVQPWFISTSLQASLQMVLMNQGVGLLPDLPSEATRHLVRVLPEAFDVEGGLFITMGQRLQDSERGRWLRQLIERARRYLSKRPGIS